MGKNQDKQREMSDSLQHIAIVQGFLEGKSQAQIARDLGVSKQMIQTALEKANQEISFQMLELSETLHLRNLARLERLIQAVWPYALGTEEEGVQLPPDRHMVKLVLDIIKQEQDWYHLVQEQRANERNREIDSDMVVAIERTFTSSNPLYMEARDGMEDDLLGFADIPIDEIYKQQSLMDFDAPPIDDHIGKLEAGLRDFLKEAEETLDDDEEA